MKDTYRKFLEAKVAAAPTWGFEAPQGLCSDRLLAHQAVIVPWLLAGGRRALFANFGLGKTVMQLEAVRICAEHEHSRGLIVLPLGVRQEFQLDAVNILGWKESPRFIRSIEEAGPTGVYLTNYETVRDGKLDPREFAAVSLDEAAILRGFGGTLTFREMMATCAGDRKTLDSREITTGVKYRFVATAVPSPNDYIELLAYAAFLGIMEVSQAKTRFFKRNSEKADQLTIHPHKETEFWQWVSTWALFITKPSDLGPEFSDDGYDVPALEVCWHELPSDHSDAGTERDGQGLLFRNVAIGVTNAAREKRDSLLARVDKLASLIAGRTDQVVTWCDLNDEQRAIEKTLSGLGISFSSLYGSQSIDEREQLMTQWRGRETQAFLSKPSMYGAGVNLQQSHTMVFVGIGFRFHEIIQAVHRIHRFQQKHPCAVHFIYTEAEREVRRDFERKWSQHNEMVEKMTALIREHGLTHAAMAHALKRSIGVERVEAKGENWTMVHNDCVIEARRLASDSVGLIVTSVPFSTQYEYSPNYSDFGHSDNNAHFFQQMDFLTPELLRALKPGRIAAIHVKDRIVPGGMTGLGMQTVYPFHAVCIDHFVRHGFAYMGMKTIITDVVRENNQTYRLGWTEQCKDGTKMGVGMPEYLLLFRKPPTDTSRSYADEPVVKSKDRYSRARWQVDAHGFTRSSGNRPITAEDLSGLPHDAIFQTFRDFHLTNVYDFEHHVRLGEALDAKGMLPVTFMLLQPPSWSDDVWSDVARMLTLNSAQSARGKELHLCPLPLDIVNRAVAQWSNPGDLVLDPFAGIGTVPYCALKLGRKAVGFELSAPYFFDACGYCKAAEREIAMPDLFAVLDRADGDRAA